MATARTASLVVLKSEVLNILNLISLPSRLVDGCQFLAAYFLVAGAGAHHGENDHHESETYGVADRWKRSGK
jgi:hypothetical protein